MSEPSSVPLSSRVLRISLVLAAPVVLLTGVGAVAVRGEAGVWPSVGTLPLTSPPAAFDACADSEARFERVLRSARHLDADALALPFDPEVGPTPEQRTLVEQAQDSELELDALLACGGLVLGPPVSGADLRRATNLDALAHARLLRGWVRSFGGDPESGAQDFAAVMRFAALLEQAGNQLEISEVGTSAGLLALRELERWLDANPAAPEEALAVLARELDALRDLPEGASSALTWNCRLQEYEYANLGAMPAPEMYLSQVGVPLWAGWLAGWLPGATTFDAPRTLAMHRHRCSLHLEALRSGGRWSDAETGPSLWDPDGQSLGMLLDNPLGRAMLERPAGAARIDVLVDDERTLRSRRALLATRVAIERGSRAHDGLLPSHLELLVPDFLDELPTDPVDGQPVNWVRSHGEIFTSREAPGPDGEPTRLLTRVPER